MLMPACRSYLVYNKNQIRYEKKREETFLLAKAIFVHAFAQISYKNKKTNNVSFAFIFRYDFVVVASFNAKLNRFSRSPGTYIHNIERDSE